MFNTKSLLIGLLAATFVFAGCESETTESTDTEETTQAAEETEEAADTEETEESADAETEEATDETEESEEDMAAQLEAPDNVAEAPEDAEVTDSGLASIVLKEGTGDTHPTATSRVTVHYTGWTTDGERFDSSVARGNPATFGLNQVIAGWTEGVQLMVVGEKRRFWIPEELAYQGRRAPFGTLVFDVELLEIQ